MFNTTDGKMLASEVCRLLQMFDWFGFKLVRLLFPSCATLAAAEDEADEAALSCTVHKRLELVMWCACMQSQRLHTDYESDDNEHKWVCMPHIFSRWRVLILHNHYSATVTTHPETAAIIIYTVLLADSHIPNWLLQMTLLWNTWYRRVPLYPCFRQRWVCQLKILSKRFHSRSKITPWIKGK